MSQILSCPQGHQWQPPEGGEGQTVFCPICGAAGHRSDSPSSGNAEPATGTYHPPLHDEAPSSDVETIPPSGEISVSGQPRPPLPATEESAAPPVIPGYEIFGELGRGGMGRVYRARQSKLDRLVALKILPPDTSRDSSFAERFTREARSLAKLNHANIVTVYDFGQTEGLSYFVMEYVDGVNLRQLMKAGLVLPQETLQIMSQLCDALQYAHDEGIVHRDIKPENILRDKRGRVKIADFGIAKLLARTTKDYTLTGPWQVLGTFHYMAPEQIENPLSLDHRADIYSLGVMFYELLTGGLPIGRFALPSQKVKMDERIDEVVLKALEKEPERRYQQVRELKTAIDELLGQLGSAIQPVTGPHSTATPSLPGERKSDLTTAQVPEQRQVSKDQVRQRLKGLALGLMVTGCVDCLFWILFWRFTAYTWWSERVDSQAHGFALMYSAAAFIGCLQGIFVIIGARQMQKLEAYQFVVFSSLVAMLPCSPAFLIGLPMGIWALITLRNQEVRAAFHGGSIEAQPITPQRLRGPTIGLMVAASLDCLLSLYACAAMLYEFQYEMSPGRMESGPFFFPAMLVAFLGLVKGIVVILGARSIWSLKAYQFGLVSCVLAIIPCTPAFLIGVPFGIWTLVLLLKKEIIAAFHSVDLEPKPITAPTREDPFKKVFGTTTGWAILICLIGCGVTFLPWVNAAHLGATIALSGYETRLGLLTGLGFLILLPLLVATAFIEPIPIWRPIALFLVAIGAIVFPLLLPTVLICSLREGAHITIVLGVGLLVLGAFQVRAILMRVQPPS